MEKNLATVLNYFSFFSYAPTFDEIHVFFPVKVGEKTLLTFLHHQIRQKSLLLMPQSNCGASKYSIGDWKGRLVKDSYTLPQYSISAMQKNLENNNAQIKNVVGTVQTYVSLLRKCPFVRFVGITGSSAMVGVTQNNDVDLCIVTKSGFLWTTRFITIFLAKILGIHSRTGVCLNLFFDESNLSVPKNKRNSYIAHEIIQMKGVLDKGSVHQRFLTENGWIFRYFPNANTHAQNNISPSHRLPPQSICFLCRMADSLFRRIQLPIIYRNHTSLSITNTQLWLFKNDFEKRLKRKGLVI